MNSTVKTGNKRALKTIAVVLSVLIAVTAIGYGIGGTFAAPGDIPVTLTEPTGFSPSVIMEVGESRQLTVGNLYMARSGDSSLATVTYDAALSSNNVTTTGVKAGIVTVAYGTKAGLVNTARYLITDSRNVSAYTLHNEGEALFDKADDPAMAAPVTFNVSSPNVVWSSTNSDVATVSGAGAITPAANGSAIIIGAFVDKWGRDQEVHILVVVGGTGDGTIITGPDGSKYRPLVRPPHVYEKLDDNGNPLVPPEYVYNPGDNPGDGNDIPATLGGDGNFYIEDPENIWTPINNNDGSLEEENKFWGGPDGKPDGGPNGGDNKPVSVFENDDGEDEYWVHMGQNVWKKYDKNNPRGPLGPLTGGGPDGNPATDPVTPIYDNTDYDGRYYVGPFGPDENGNEYYYGDPRPDGNGKLDSTGDPDPAQGLKGDDVLYYKNEDGSMTTTMPPRPPDPPKPITEIPTGTDDGRVLTPGQTGDTVNWLEIARNGDYSLIVRTDFINVNDNGRIGEAAWQGTPFGSNGVYGRSEVRDHINNWFNGRAGSALDNLAAGARLRSFTASNNASNVLGTGSSDSGGLTNGFSKPTGYLVGAGNDIAFALSFTEAANFISREYNTNAGGGVAPSTALAIANFGRLTPHAFTDYLWLRNAGTNTTTSGTLQHDGGRAFQLAIGTAALVYPALWVHSSIFD